MNELRVAAVQLDLLWESKEKNLDKMECLLSKNKENVHLWVFPEMCTTGFSVNNKQLAETVDGYTLSRLKTMAQKYAVYLMGSMILKKDEDITHSFFLISPQEEVVFSHKRHLFSFAHESASFSKGENRMVFQLYGWKILPLICYDLRFPVWSRNKLLDGVPEYDCLIYIANWPSVRSKAWKSLLPARAIENQAYVIGVNRVGKDAHELHYQGDSCILSFSGKPLAMAIHKKETIIYSTLSKRKLNQHRQKFPFLNDADCFSIL